MPDVAEQFAPAVRRLVECSESNLYAELGRRVRLLEGDPAAAASPSMPAIEFLGPTEELAELGKLFFRRLSRNAHDLVCGSSGEFESERSKLRNALGDGANTFSGALAAGLVTHFGIAAGVAVVVSVITVKLFFQSGYEAGCAYWGKHLDTSS